MDSKSGEVLPFPIDIACPKEAAPSPAAEARVPPKMTPEQEAQVKRLSEELMKEPFFAMWERTGVQVFQMCQGIRARMQHAVSRTWDKDQPPEQERLLQRMLDEIDERMRDICSRVQDIGIMASQSKRGAEAVEEAKAVEAAKKGDLDPKNQEPPAAP